MLEFQLIDVNAIESNLPRSNFPEADLDRLAELILEADGIMRPLVLKQTGVESYQVLEGHLEYYAAVRAKEKNSRQAELVNAFVVPAKLEAQVRQQVQLLRSVDAPPALDKPIPTSPAVANYDDARLTNLELRLEKYISEQYEAQTAEKRELDARLKQLEAHLTQPKQSEARFTQPIDPLERLNSLTVEELEVELKRSRIPTPAKLAKAIGEARRKQPEHRFENYTDVVNLVEGLGDKRMLTIIDAWSRR